MRDDVSSRIAAHHTRFENDDNMKRNARFARSSTTSSTQANRTARTTTEDSDKDSDE
jgi:hypothetical protein